MFPAMGQEHKDSSTDFGNTSVEIQKVEASCSVRAQAGAKGKGLVKLEVTEKPQLSPIEESLIESAKAFASDKETQRFDNRIQEGDSPADFGDHKPIPLDSVCASVVISGDKELENELDDELEQRLDRVIKEDEDVD
jgi:hypothetical protein